MNEKTINEQYAYIRTLLEEKRLKEALMQLESLLWQCPDWDLRTRLEQLQTSYKYMLEYMKQGANDPERWNLYQKMVSDTWGIADQSRLLILDNASSRYYHEVRRTPKSPDLSNYGLKTILHILESFNDDLAVSGLLSDEKMDEVLKIVVMGRAARNTANIKNRQPIGTMYVKAEKAMDKFYTDIIADELNVKEVKFADDVESFISYSFKPQLRTVGPKYGKLLNGIRTALSEVDGTAAMKELRDNGVLVLDIAGNRVELAEEDLLIETAQSEGYVTETDGETSVVLDTNLTPELIQEGFVREIISKVQTMRKEAGFEVMDKIIVYAKDNDKIMDIMKANQDEIKREVLAENIILGEAEGYTKEWNINKEAVTLGVSKVQEEN